MSRFTSKLDAPVRRQMQVADSEFAAVSEGRIRIRIGSRAV